MKDFIQLSKPEIEQAIKEFVQEKTGREAKAITTQTPALMSLAMLSTVLVELGGKVPTRLEVTAADCDRAYKNGKEVGKVDALDELRQVPISERFKRLGMVPQYLARPYALVGNGVGIGDVLYNMKRYTADDGAKKAPERGAFWCWDLGREDGDLSGFTVSRIEAGGDTIYSAALGGDKETVTPNQSAEPGPDTPLIGQAAKYRISDALKEKIQSGSVTAALKERMQQTTKEAAEDIRQRAGMPLHPGYVNLFGTGFHIGNDLLKVIQQSASAMGRPGDASRIQDALRNVYNAGQTEVSGTLNIKFSPGQQALLDRVENEGFLDAVEQMARNHGPFFGTAQTLLEWFELNGFTFENAAEMVKQLKENGPALEARDVHFSVSETAKGARYHLAMVVSDEDESGESDGPVFRWIEGKRGVEHLELRAENNEGALLLLESAIDSLNIPDSEDEELPFGTIAFGSMACAELVEDFFADLAHSDEEFSDTCVRVIGDLRKIQEVMREHREVLRGKYIADHASDFYAAYDALGNEALWRKSKADRKARKKLRKQQRRQVIGQ